MANIEGVNKTIEAMKAVAAEEIHELRVEQQESQEEFQASLTEMTNPLLLARRSREKDDKPIRNRVKEALKSGDKTEVVEAIKDLDNKADQYQGRNPELKSDALKELRRYLKPDDDKETILKKVQQFYPDVSLADEALDFLMETTDGDLFRNIQGAKEDFNAAFGREIAAGRNIHEEARAAAGGKLGTPTDLRQLYRDITGNPRDSSTLFDELSGRYTFKDLAKVSKFLLHSLGADMKSQGPSIPRGFLHTLINETRSLQAILGVYTFFSGRMDLLKKLFNKEALPIPNQLTFEALAKQFMSLVAERYPTSSKVLQKAANLGIEDGLQAKIFVISQLRDAVRAMAPNYIYKSIPHRDEVYMSIIEALEDLEEELDELLNEQEEDEIDEVEDHDDMNGGGAPPSANRL